MTAVRKRCLNLFVFTLCSLTIVLGTNQQVICHEGDKAHLQLFECSPLQHASLPANQPSTIKANTGSDIDCPDCLDTNLSFLNTRVINFSFHAIFEAGQALFSGNQYYFEPFNLVEVQQQHLTLTLPHEAKILACIRATVLLI